MDYPANQEIGKSARKDRSTRIEYCLGRVYEAMGQAQSAEEAFRNAADSSEREGSEADYFRGRAMLKTGRWHEAEELFQKMEKTRTRTTGKQPETVNYFAKVSGRKKLSASGLHKLIVWWDLRD
jgi:pentatricopeptide repeat protein